jgi:hypothetical protein
VIASVGLVSNLPPPSLGLVSLDITHHFQASYQDRAKPYTIPHTTHLGGVPRVRRNTKARVHLQCNVGHCTAAPVPCTRRVGSKMEEPKNTTTFTIPTRLSAPHCPKTPSLSALAQTSVSVSHSHQTPPRRKPRRASGVTTSSSRHAALRRSIPPSLSRASDPVCSNAVKSG